VARGLGIRWLLIQNRARTDTRCWERAERQPVERTVSRSFWEKLADKSNEEAEGRRNRLSRSRCARCVTNAMASREYRSVRSWSPSVLGKKPKNRDILWPLPSGIQSALYFLKVAENWWENWRRNQRAVTILNGIREADPINYSCLGSLNISPRIPHPPSSLLD